MRRHQLFSRLNLKASAVNGEILQIDRLTRSLHGTGRPTHPFRQRITFSTLGPAAFSCPLINSNTTAESFRARRTVAMHRPVAEGRRLKLN